MFMKEPTIKHGILLMLTLILLPAASSAQGFFGSLLKGINDATQEVLKEQQEMLKEQMKPQYNWVEWVPVKQINRDGSVSKYDETAAIGVESRKFSLNGDFIYHYTGALLIINNEYNHSAYKFHHMENGNKVYYYFGNPDHPEYFKWNFSRALILSADGNTINVLQFDNPINKNITKGSVFKKIVSTEIGGMYE